jgi:PilZ domain
VPVPIYDQRAERRVTPPPNATAKLYVLKGSTRTEVGIAQVVNFSGRGLRLRVGQALSAGTLVRVDLNETLILAEVCYAEPDGDEFAIGLRLEHSLTQTEGLERLRQRFAEEAELDTRIAVSR